MNTGLRQRLSVARDAVNGTGPIQQRLLNAAISGLAMLQPDDFNDPEVRNLFESVMRDLTAKGDIPTTTAAMSDDVAQPVAEKILQLARAAGIA